MSVWSVCLFLFCWTSLAAEDAVKKPLVGEEKVQEKPSSEKAGEKAGEDELVEDELDDIDRSKQEPRLSNKWFRGNYLVYDCDDGHFACVNENSFIKCENQRTERIEEKDPQLGCAPLKKFKTQKNCFEVQYKKLHNQLPKVFCLHPDLR